jgi:hypothetical protein
MNWQDKMISLYLFLCKAFNEGLYGMCERMSNHADLSFSDEEVMTIFMFGIIEGRRELKNIYQHTYHHLYSWFPKLPSYVAFVQRINKLNEVFIPIIEKLQSFLPDSFANHAFRLLDSMPIIMAKNNRRFKACVAAEIADKNGYCSTKNLYYYGVKLHVIGSYLKGSMPVPEYIGLTAAGVSDRRAFEEILPFLPNINLVADKAYQKGSKPLFYEENVQMYTPAKKQKGQQFLESADQLLSTAVSRVRQPIESFFNWLHEKTGIQIASKVRSYNGLMVHVFGRLAAAMFMLMNKLSS